METYGVGWFSFSTDTELTFKGVAFVIFHSWCITSEHFVGFFAGTATVACCEELLCKLLTEANRLFHIVPISFVKSLPR